MADICGHLDTIVHVEGREGVPGCPACIELGSRWVHLRRCTQCGQVGCCDDSPNRHASHHHEATGHPVETLTRVRIGPLKDSRLKPGQFRDLTPEEVRRLKKSAE